MALFRLIATLGLNSTEFHSGLQRADAAATRIGKSMASNLTSKFVTAFGVEAIRRWTMAAVSSAAEIRKLAKETGLTTTQVQLIQAAARDAGTSFDEMRQRVGENIGTLQRFKNELQFSDADLESIQRFEASMDRLGSGAKVFMGRLIVGFREMWRTITGGPRGGVTLPPLAPFSRETPDADVATELAQMRMETLFNEMTPAGQLTELQRQLAATGIGISNLEGDLNPSAQKELIGLMKERSRLQKEIQDRLATKTQTASFRAPSVNALQQIGAFVGANPVVQEQRQATMVLRKIESNTRKRPLEVARSSF